MPNSTNCSAITVNDDNFDDLLNRLFFAQTAYVRDSCAHIADANFCSDDSHDYLNDALDLLRQLSTLRTDGLPADLAYLLNATDDTLQPSPIISTPLCLLNIDGLAPAIYDLRPLGLAHFDD